MKVVNVLKPNKYNVYIGNNITYRMLERFTFDKVLVLADDALDEADINNILNAFPNSYLYKIRACEENKNLNTFENIINKLIELDFSPSDYILGLGGGIVCDIAGYVASSYKRGMKLILVPTTMLAMVDASIGSKVAINHQNLKNVIGTFYSPEMVIIDPYYLHSLPKRIFNAGLMEAVKMGLTLDKEIINLVSEKDYLNVIISSINAKTKVINLDPFDKNLRHVLNFGHTIAHAIELNSSYLHGEAVAIGMVFMIKDPILKEKVINDLSLYFDIESGIRFVKENKQTVLENIKNDKKIINSINYYLNDVVLNKLNDYSFVNLRLSDYEVMIDE